MFEEQFFLSNRGAREEHQDYERSCQRAPVETGLFRGQGLRQTNGHGYRSIGTRSNGTTKTGNIHLVFGHGRSQMSAQLFVL